MGELPAPEKKGDDPAPRTELEDILPRLRPDEIGQKRSVKGEPVAIPLLPDDDQPFIESVSRFSTTGTDENPDAI